MPNLEATDQAAIERRCARLSRRCAKLILGLKRDGELAAAAKLEHVAIEAVELVRRGAL